MGISVDVISKELEIHQSVLKLFNIHGVNEKATLISWLDFVNLAVMLLFRKPLINQRIQFLLRFLQLKNFEAFSQKNYFFIKFTELNRGKPVKLSEKVQDLWDKLRFFLSENLNEILDSSTQIFNHDVIVRLILSDKELITQVNTCLFEFFDQLFEIY